MGDVFRYPIPAGYNHKATSESFSGTEKVIIYYSGEEAEYLVVFESHLNEDVEESGTFINKTQLQLLVHAGADVLDMDAR